jgi:hypothetical protein
MRRALTRSHKIYLFILFTMIWRGLCTHRFFPRILRIRLNTFHVFRDDLCTVDQWSQLTLPSFPGIERGAGGDDTYWKPVLLEIGRAETRSQAPPYAFYAFMQGTYYICNKAMHPSGRLYNVKFLFSSTVSKVSYTFPTDSFL